MIDSPHDSPLSRVLPRLHDVKAAGQGKYLALCPAHDDKRHSLSVTTGKDGRVLLNCHAGCAFAAIVGAMGITQSDTFADAPRSQPGAVAPAVGVDTRPRLVKTYDYTDADGNLLYQVCRFEPKNFRQRRRDGDQWVYNLNGVEPVLYRLPQIVEAAEHGRRLFLVEGEKDADALADEGYPATTVSGGAKNWRARHAETLKGLEIVILPDNDDAGSAYAEQAAADLTSQGCTVKIVALPDLPPKGDVSDWLKAGGTAPRLEQLVAKAPAWTARPAAPPRFKILSVRDLESLPPLDWLIGEEMAGILPANALLAIFGAPSAGKSFVAADLACTIASRRVDLVPDWFGNTVTRGPVLYVVAEGGRGFRSRIMAWRQHHQHEQDDLDLHFVVEPVNLFASDDVSHLLRAADLLPEPPALVVFDTLARSMVGGDDSSSQDVGLVIDRGARVSRETGASSMFIHHAKKDTDIERGSTALRGGVDTLCLVREDEETGRVLACEKQKDAEPFVPVVFHLLPVGESCVVSAQPPAGVRAPTASQRAALSVLCDVFVKGATSSEWKAAAGISERTFYRVRAKLVRDGYVSEVERGNSVRYLITQSGHWFLHGNIT